MRVVIQRVQKASVRINKKEDRSIGAGLLVLVGADRKDTREDIDWLVKKMVKMRIFEDSQKKMNLSIEETGGDLMIISQFTLLASTRKGNRPSFNPAAEPEKAILLYESFLKKAEEELKKPVVSGEFGAYMEVSMINDGPVTIQMDSHNRE